MSMVEWQSPTTSKVILGSTLTSQADGKTSTNALGNVHNRSGTTFWPPMRASCPHVQQPDTDDGQPERLAGCPATPVVASWCLMCSRKPTLRAWRKPSTCWSTMWG